MVQRGDGPRLPLEPLQRRFPLRQLRGRKLDRDLPAQHDVPGPVQLAHPSRADAPQDLVVRDRASDHRWPSALNDPGTRTRLARVYQESRSGRRGAVYFREAWSESERYTTFPPTIVYRIFALSISSSGTVRMFFVRTAMSASFPTVSEPLTSSSKAA